MYQEIEEENIQKELNFNQDYFNPDPNNENNNISTRINAQNGINGMNDSLTEEKPKNKDENVKYIFLKDVSESPKLEDKKHILIHEIRIRSISYILSHIIIIIKKIHVIFTNMNFLGLIWENILLRYTL